MKKSLPLFLSLIAITSLSADATSAAKPAATPPKPIMKQPTGTVTPSVSPLVAGAERFVLWGDFIWWKPTLDGLEYASGGFNDGMNVGLSENVKQGHAKSPKFEFTPGFKVGMSYLISHDGWDISAEYTWLRGDKKRNSIEAKSVNGVAGEFDCIFNTGDDTYPYVSKASSRFRNFLNELDFELGRNFFVSRYLSLRPNFGVKVAWFEDKLGVHYDTLPASPVNNFDTDWKQDMWGIGIRAGLDTQWHITKNWAIYGDLALSGLWSYYNTHEKQEYETDILSVKTIDIKEKIQMLTPVIEFGLGLSYMTWFSKDRYYFFIQAGWEEQVWINFNNFMDAGFVRGGDLNIQGLTLKMGLAF